MHTLFSGCIKPILAMIFYSVLHLDNHLLFLLYILLVRLYIIYIIRFQEKNLNLGQDLNLGPPDL